MTEDEARKILDWLCNRFKKKIIDFYEHGNVRFRILLKFSERKWYVNHKYNTLSLDFEYAWTDASDTWRHTNNILYIAHEHPDVHDDTLEIDVDHAPHTDAEFLDILFKLNAVVYVKDWFEGGTCFINKGESLEELKIKMDLEDV